MWQNRTGEVNYSAKLLIHMISRAFWWLKRQQNIHFACIFAFCKSCGQQHWLPAGLHLYAAGRLWVDLRLNDWASYFLLNAMIKTLENPGPLLKEKHLLRVSEIEWPKQNFLRAGHTHPRFLIRFLDQRQQSNRVLDPQPSCFLTFYSLLSCLEIPISLGLRAFYMSCLEV